MTTPMIVAVVFINVAFVLYSVGVWAEKIQGRLKGWHLAFFWSGLVADTTGTGAMELLAGGLTFNVHGITGLAALILMAFHAVWATYVLRRGDETRIVGFHRLSLAVWLVWLVPFIGGIVLGTHV
jgi:uncharacterized repeat protein (TIGR03987 family)